MVGFISSVKTRKNTDKKTKRQKKRKYPCVLIGQDVILCSWFLCFINVCVRVWGGVLEHGRMIPSWGLCSESKVCFRDRDLATLPHTLTGDATASFIPQMSFYFYNLLFSPTNYNMQKKKHTLLVRLISQTFRIRLTTKIWNQNKIVEPIQNNFWFKILNTHIFFKFVCI